jgi:hypothetical protein
MIASLPHWPAAFPPSNLPAEIASLPPGVQRWLRPLTLPHGFGRLEITSPEGQTTAYDVQAVLAEDRHTVLGFLLADDDDNLSAVMFGSVSGRVTGAGNCVVPRSSLSCEPTTPR